LTYSGRFIDLFDPSPNDIVLEDIAHGLACCNRFAGHTRRPITVAQHSVYVARVSNCAQGLFHDASEAYLGDMTKWLKGMPEMEMYRTVEEKLQRIIYQKYGCPEEMTPGVAYADKLMLRFEGGQGYGEEVWDEWLAKLPGYPPVSPEERTLIGPWAPWGWRQSKEAFLAHYRTLDVS
jgi:hypothetical protein